MKKLFGLSFILLILLIGMNSIAYGANFEIQPRFTGLKDFVCSLSLDGKDAKMMSKATCSSDYKVKVKVELQKYDGSKWTTIKTMFGTKSFYSSVNENCTVDTGGTYRLNCTATVYDNNGKVVETATIKSEEKYN